MYRLPADPGFVEALGKLQEFRQRATYGALGGVLGKKSVRNLVQGHDRDALHSWVFAQEGGLPTGYTGDNRHGLLLSRDRVIAEADEFRAWPPTVGGLPPAGVG